MAPSVRLPPCLDKAAVARWPETDTSRRFYQFHILNGRTHIAGALDNEKYSQIVPQTFEGFLNAHAMEELAGSMEALGKLR